jgi:hypothetical protein
MLLKLLHQYTDGNNLLSNTRLCVYIYTERVAKNMKIVLNICGVLMILFGCIWFLQGINVLPGSFMTGQIRWAVYGGIAAAAGIVVLVRTNRRRRV